MAANLISSSAVWSADPLSRCGPFKDGSNNLWVVLLAGTGTAVGLTAYKSTDKGATWPSSWVSSANFMGGGSTNLGTVDCAFDSTNGVIYCLVQLSSRVVQIWKFTISTTTWARVDTGTGPTLSADGVAATGVSGYRNYLVRRSTGEFVVHYQGPTASVMGSSFSRTYYARCSSAGTWSAGVEDDNVNGQQSNAYCKSAVLGPSDAVELSFHSGFLVRQTLSSANVLATVGGSIAIGANGDQAVIFYDSVSGFVRYGTGGANDQFYRYTSPSASGSSLSDANSLLQGNNVDNGSSNCALIYEPVNDILFGIGKLNSNGGMYYNTCATPASNTSWGSFNTFDLNTTAGISVGLGVDAGTIGVIFNQTSATAGVYFELFTLAGPKAITPAAISATSTVSGTVRLKPRITAGSFAATSTISGNVVAKRKIAPAAISATSTVSGSVAKLKALPVAAISATSTVSGATRATKLIKPAVISATATVSGDIIVRIAVAGVITATSTLSGNVRATHKIGGALSATSTISGRIGRRYALYLPGSLSLKNSAPLDDFNRAGTTTPPSANWSQIAITNGLDLQLAGDSDTVISPTAGFASGDYWNPSTFGPDSEVFIDITELDMADDNQISLWLRGSGLGALATKTGYRLDWYPDGFNSINRVINNGSAQINGASQMGGTGQNQLNNGDSIGFQVLGTGAVVTLISWFKPAGGNWYPLNVVQDVAANRIVTAGNIGLQLYGRNATNPKQAVTAFYGGTAVAAVASAQIWVRSTIGGTVIKAGGPKPIPPAQISATSTVSGSVRALRKIAPAQVSATSTVGGSVVAKRAITPAQVAATSTISGAVRVTRKITTQNINAFAAISGAIAPKRGILPAAISATSTVSGAIVTGGPKPIAPAQISATSTISGAVRVTRKIAPAQISATSTVSGSVGVRRAVIPAQISATSTISGAVAPRRGILPAQIAATSTISGSGIRVTRKIAPAQIAATSTVSGNVIAIHKISGAVSATSTVSGAVRVTRAIFPAQISATASVSGNVRVTRAIIPANIAATSTVSGLVGVRRKVAPAAISATSTVSGAVARIPAGKYITPTTNINAFSTITGSVRRLAAVGGAVLATSTVSGALRALRRVSGAIAATSTISGSLVARRAVVPAQIAATSTISGAVRVIRKIAPANVLASSTISGSIVVGPKKPVTPAQITATSTISGAVRAIRGITPAGISAISTISGRIVRRFLVLPAQILATSTISGTIGRRKAITPAQILATSTISGAIKRLRTVAGVIAASSTIAGAVRKRIAIRGVVTATSAISGSLVLRGKVPFVGHVTATSTISGSLRFKRVIRGQILATSSISGRIVRIVHPRGAITATSTIHGATVTIRAIRGQILATSHISGSIQPGRVVHGRTKPRITSVGWPRPELISAGNGIPKLVSANGTSTSTKPQLVAIPPEIPVLERVR